MQIMKAIMLVAVVAAAAAVSSCASKPEPVAPQQSVPSTYGYSK